MTSMWAAPHEGPLTLCWELPLTRATDSLLGAAPQEGHWLSDGSCSSQGPTDSMMGAVPHEGPLTLLGAAPQEGPLTLLGATPHIGPLPLYLELPLMRGHWLYWELSLMRGSCLYFSNILITMVTKISASLSKPRLHSNAKGFSPKMPNIFKQLYFWMPWQHIGFHGNRYQTILFPTDLWPFMKNYLVIHMINGIVKPWEGFLVPLATVVMITRP